jgi:hypothetical protein
MFESRWEFGTKKFPTGLGWLLSDHSRPWGSFSFGPEPFDSYKMAHILKILEELFPGAPEVATAEADMDPRTARLADPMSAQDFYNNHLREKHQDYKNAARWHKDNRANDFAEALATGIRADEIGYEALRKRVAEAAPKDFLGFFRADWNNWLRLERGTGNNDPITINEDGDREVNGKTKKKARKDALYNMEMTSDYLDKIL